MKETLAVSMLQRACRVIYDRARRRLGSDQQNLARNTLLIAFSLSATICLHGLLELTYAEGVKHQKEKWKYSADSYYPLIISKQFVHVYTIEDPPRNLSDLRFEVNGTFYDHTAKQCQKGQSFIRVNEDEIFWRDEFLRKAFGKLGENDIRVNMNPEDSEQLFESRMRLRPLETALTMQGVNMEKYLHFAMGLALIYMFKHTCLRTRLRFGDKVTVDKAGVTFMGVRYKTSVSALSRQEEGTVVSLRGKVCDVELGSKRVVTVSNPRVHRSQRPKRFFVYLLGMNLMLFVMHALVATGVVKPKGFLVAPSDQFPEGLKPHKFELATQYLMTLVVYATMLTA